MKTVLSQARLDCLSPKPLALLCCFYICSNTALILQYPFRVTMGIIGGIGLLPITWLGLTIFHEYI